MACQVLSSVNARVFSLVQGTFLVLQYTERALIKFWRLCAPHIQRCDGNLTVGISLTLWAGKPTQLFLIGGINTNLNRFASLLYTQEFLRTYPEFSQISNQTHVSFQHKKPIQ